MAQLSLNVDISIGVLVTAITTVNHRAVKGKFVGYLKYDHAVVDVGGTRRIVDIETLSVVTPAGERAAPKLVFPIGTRVQGTRINGETIRGTYRGPLLGHPDKYSLLMDLEGDVIELDKCAVPTSSLVDLEQRKIPSSGIDATQETVPTTSATPSPPTSSGNSVSSTARKQSNEAIGVWGASRPIEAPEVITQSDPSAATAKRLQFEISATPSPPTSSGNQGEECSSAALGNLISKPVNQNSAPTVSATPSPPTSSGNQGEEYPSAALGNLISKPVNQNSAPTVSATPSPPASSGNSARRFWHSVSAYPSRGKRYFRYQWGEGSGPNATVHIRGGQTNNPAAIRNAGLIQSAIDRGDTPTQIIEQIRGLK